MNPKYLFFLLVLAAVLLEAVSDIFFKKWSMDNRKILLGIGLFIYFIGTVFWAISLKYEYLSKAITIFTILNLLIIVLVGVYFFDEKLSVLNKIGIAVGVLSVMLVEL